MSELEEEPSLELEEEPSLELEEELSLELEEEPSPELEEEPSPEQVEALQLAQELAPPLQVAWGGAGASWLADPASLPLFLHRSTAWVVAAGD